MKLEIFLGYTNKYGHSLTVCKPGELKFGVDAEVITSWPKGQLGGQLFVVTTTKPMHPSECLVLKYRNKREEEFWFYNSRGEKIATKPVWEAEVEKTLAGRPGVVRHYSRHDEAEPFQQVELLGAKTCGMIRHNHWEENDRWSATFYPTNTVQEGDKIAIREWSWMGRKYDEVVVFLFQGNEFVMERTTPTSEL